MTLFRTGDIVMALLILCTAFATYEVKYEAQKRCQEVRILQRKIEAERDTANLLRARFALAVSPMRIERLANLYSEELQLQDIDARQVVSIDDVPKRPPDAIENIIKNSDIFMVENALPETEGGNFLDKTALGSIAGGEKQENYAVHDKKRDKIGSGNYEHLPQPPQVTAVKIHRQEQELKQKMRHRQPPYALPSANRAAGSAAAASALPKTGRENYAEGAAL